MTQELPSDVDVVVIGAGPAGSTIAHRLAALNFDVLVLEAAAFPRPHLGESLPARISHLFDELGIREEIEDARFFRPGGAIVRWSGETRLRTDIANGFQVDRGRFDMILLDAAQRAGVRVVQPARVVQFRHPRDGDWRLSVLDRGQARNVHCRFVVDATGRKGFLPGERIRLQPPTLAYSAYWQDTGLDGVETRVEAGADQWYWAAPLPDGTTNITVFIDPTLSTRPKAVGNAYRQWVAQSQLLSGCLGGKPVTSVQVISAAATRVREPIGADWLKIGEAALAVDPLSSQGVQSAIVSGLQGAAIVYTLMTEPAAQAAALAFCHDCLNESTKRHLDHTGEFYGQQAQVTPTEFWRMRAPAEIPAILRPPPVSVTRIGDAVRLNPSATWKETAVLCDHRIAWQPALQLPSQQPVAWLGNESLSDLLPSPRVQWRTQELLSHWSETMTFDRSVQTLGWLCAQGYLIPSGFETE